MSITETYFLAQAARGKLAREAAQPDHDLRLLVGHANLLDSVMLELAEAEQEQERWFNQSVKGASNSSGDEPKHIKWADTIVEEPEYDWNPEDDGDSDSYSDSDDSDYDEEDIFPSSTHHETPTLPVFVSSRELDGQDDDEGEDDGYHTEDDDEDLTLTRTPSRQQPPELLSDSDEESDDDSMPPSPPQPTFDSFSDEGRRAISTTSFYDKDNASASANAPLSESDKSHFLEEGFFLPQRQQPTSPIEVY